MDVDRRSINNTDEVIILRGRASTDAVAPDFNPGDADETNKSHRLGR